MPGLSFKFLWVTEVGRHAAVGRQAAVAGRRRLRKAGSSAPGGCGGSPCDCHPGTGAGAVWLPAGQGASPPRAEGEHPCTYCGKLPAAGAAALGSLRVVSPRCRSREASWCPQVRCRERTGGSPLPGGGMCHPLHPQQFRLLRSGALPRLTPQKTAFGERQLFWS